MDVRYIYLNMSVCMFKFLYPIPAEILEGSYFFLNYFVGCSTRVFVLVGDKVEGTYRDVLIIQLSRLLIFV